DVVAAGDQGPDGPAAQPRVGVDPEGPAGRGGPARTRSAIRVPEQAGVAAPRPRPSAASGEGDDGQQAQHEVTAGEDDVAIHREPSWQGVREAARPKVNSGK